MGKREADMFPVVDAWLKEKGYEVWTEIPHYASCVDVVARHPESREIIAVEMKLGLTKQVIRQAYIAATAVNFSYCAVASNPRQSGVDDCKRRLVGLLRVRKDSVIEIMAPNKEGWAPEIKLMHKRLDRYPQGGTAGLPQQKGVGPAIECAREVKKFFGANSTATWRDAFSEIENHYASYASMRGALVSRGLV